MKLFEVGSLVLTSYLVMLIVGTVGMFYCLVQRRQIFQLNIWKCIVFTLCLASVGVLGAMLLYFIETGQFGGISFYGSLFLIPLLMPLFGMLIRLKPMQTMDACGPCVAWMIGCLRVNCFLSGCCGGWTIRIGSCYFALPTQMLDSIADFLIFAKLLKWEQGKPQSGILYPLFVITYSTMRFFLEFLRDTPKDWLYLSHGQWFAIASVAISSIWLLHMKKRVHNWEEKSFRCLL